MATTEQAGVTIVEGLPDHEEIEGRHASAATYVKQPLRFDVQTDETAVEVTSPASVRIPAGTPHCFVVHEATTKPCVFPGILIDTSRHGASDGS